MDASELMIVNRELAFQIEERKKRAAELLIANKELAFQNKEKEKRAAELVIANKELVFQNEEKEKRAQELIIANKELAFQNDEKEKRAAELMIANKELESFNLISSHDLQEPLRKIQTFVSIIFDNEFHKLSHKGQEGFNRIKDSADRMRSLIDDIMLYSNIKTSAHNFEHRNLKEIVDNAITHLSEPISKKKAIIEMEELDDAYIIPSQFQQLFHNLLHNSLKFSNKLIPLRVTIKSRIIDHAKTSQQQLLAGKSHCHISISDNGIGFDPQYKSRIFDVFQQLNDKLEYGGTGIGLAIAKRIVENHHGTITADGMLHEGATFNIYIPNVEKNMSKTVAEE